MKRVLVLGIILAAAGSAGCLWIAKLHHKKQPYEAEPFYRKYLVAGSKLDDQILEEERRVQAQPDDPNLRNDFGNLLAQRRFPEDASGVLREVARRRLTHTVASGWPLLEPTWRFWNSLVAASAPR